MWLSHSHFPHAHSPSCAPEIDDFHDLGGISMRLEDWQKGKGEGERAISARKKKGKEEKERG